MKLLKFLEFINESLRDFQLPTYFSKDFIEKLLKIDSPITKELVLFSYKRAESSFSLIDLGDFDDTIKYTDSYKFDQAWSKDHPEDQGFLTSHNFMLKTDGLSATHRYMRQNRTEIKIGRFIKRLFGDKFTDSEIEKFVNKWKSISESDTNKFELWHDIPKAYKSINYHFSESGHSVLMNSCMNDVPFVGFYSGCDVQVLVLLDKDDKILGRSLIWNDYQDRKIMDRVYYTYDKDYWKFINYAKSNGLYFKDGDDVVLKEGGEKLKTKVRVPDVFRYYGDGLPYMDTFYYVQGEWAYNYENPGRTFFLRDTEGGYEEYESPEI
jgi:hypothetical protein